MTFGVDASVYVRPLSARTAFYDYGRVTVPPQTKEWTFETVGQLRADERPHLSVHESGKCHVRTSSGAVGGVDVANIGPLNSFTGAHVASVFASDVRGLPLLTDVWPDEGSTRDRDAAPWDVTPSRTEGALRVLVSVSRRPHASGLHPDAFKSYELSKRRSDGGERFVALYAKADPDPLGEHAIGVIGGWDPSDALDPSKDAPFLFIRDVLTQSA